MNTRPLQRNDASERQVQAADPASSTWVLANAGSGKTRVLIDRVARLLLNGTEPQRILCLTYTKAAATEMQNRLFKRLGEWAMLGDEKLRDDLAQLGEGPVFHAEDLARARRLFARALETPGGLRIQTIHSFCATLLRRFPLEAKISPNFSEMDDRASQLLRSRIVEEMAEARAPEMMAEIAANYSGDDFADFMEQVASARNGFGAAVDEKSIRHSFGIGAAETADSILAECLQGGEKALFDACIPSLLRAGATDITLANGLAGIDFAASPVEQLNRLFAACLTKTGTLRKSQPTASATKALGPLADELKDFLGRVAMAREKHVALTAMRKTLLLHRFAAIFLPLYEQAKAAHGWLDFDDLITRAKQLLTDRSVAQWVLYRLDGGIDHILVDESQDTAPDQWKVIELLAEEFTSGEGAGPDRVRTLFVVGDKKQSIYSFQGADVAAFDEKHRFFEAKFAAVQKKLMKQELLHSFRSAPAILKLVDETFCDEFAVSLGGDTQHLAFHQNLPGRVDVWPLIEPIKTAEDENWDDPVDLISETHHTAVLANKIASEIRRLIDCGTQIPGEKGVIRPVHAGDFLILVQRRSDLFSEIIRACKAAKLPIAGADRLRLGGELAVKDLAALLSFLATPEDDLSLAVVLRSPLCGWSEDELFRLAHGRAGYLWEALRHNAADSDCLQMLQDLRDQADFLRPYDLLDRVLTRHAGRQRLIARLGEEAEEGIDALLAQALSYEQSDVPSLTGFLIWMETDEVIIKRQMDGAGDKIRVMTVHGAKGLEAPIVILPDTADRTPRDHDMIYELPGGLPVWQVEESIAPAQIRNARADRKTNRDAENARLLYVALTRPQTWLIVAAAGDAKTETGTDKPKPKPVEDWCWYRQVERAMQAAGATVRSDGILRLESGNWPGEKPGETASHNPAPALPDWALNPAPAEDRPAQAISPSKLGGAKVLASEDPSQGDEAAILRGTMLHLLLERLPQLSPQEWPRAAAELIDDPAICAQVLPEAVRLIKEPALDWVFSAESLAEQPFVARLGGQILDGTFDRLLIKPDCVKLVDFKSNALVPQTAKDVPEGILRQMGAYVSALTQIFPNRRIEAFILWTRTADLMALDPDMMSAALNRAAIP